MNTNKPTYKITYIGAFKNLWDEEGNARALESLGHKVTRYEERNFNPDEDLPKILSDKPDFIFMAKLKLPVGREIVFKEFKRAGITTVCWNFDLYWGLDREVDIKTDPIFRCDYVFTPDGGNDSRWKNAGVNHYCVRQGIHKGYCYKGKNIPMMTHDVSFVGSENKHWKKRKDMCQQLMQSFDFHWYGRINTLDIRGDKLNDLYTSTKVIVGDSVYSPYYWSNRIYETLGRGGFLLFHNVEGIENDYTPYKHFIPYEMNNWKDLTNKVTEYLKKSEDRKRLSEAALKHTLENHTLEHRCQEILKYIG